MTFYELVWKEIEEKENLKDDDLAYIMPYHSINGIYYIVSFDNKKVACDCEKAVLDLCDSHNKFPKVGSFSEHLMGFFPSRYINRYHEIKNDILKIKY